MLTLNTTIRIIKKSLMKIIAFLSKISTFSNKLGLFYKLLVVKTFILCTVANVLAQKETGQFVTEISNDMFVGTDKEYTAGMKFSFTPKGQRFTLHASWDIYTPSDIAQTTPNEGEHPYGAFGYLGFDIRFELLENLILTLTHNSAETGEQLRGEDLQNQIHKFSNQLSGEIRNPEAEGWSTQVQGISGTESAFKLAYEFPYLSIDRLASTIFYLGERNGDFFKYSNMGVQLAFGYNTRTFDVFVDSTTNFVLFFYGEIEMRRVEKNVLLEGIKDDYPYAVTPERNIYLYTMGLMLGYKGLDISFELVETSKTYTTQEHNGKTGHSWGVVRLINRY